jgi:valyl-tRNA synthetase
VKGRSYGVAGDSAAASATASLQVALSTFQRLFAPFLPFVTDEVWSWWQEGSIHNAPWPRLDAGGDDTVLTAAGWVLGAVRKAKTEAKRSMRSSVELVVVRAPSSTLAGVEAARTDLIEAGSIAALRLEESEEPETTVTLAAEPAL